MLKAKYILAGVANQQMCFTEQVYDVAVMAAGVSGGKSMPWSAAANHMLQTESLQLIIPRNSKKNQAPNGVIFNGDKRLRQ